MDLNKKYGISVTRSDIKILSFASTSQITLSEMFPTGLSYLLCKIRTTPCLLYSRKYANISMMGALFIQKVVSERYFEKEFCISEMTELKFGRGICSRFYSTQREQLHVWYSWSTILILQVVSICSYYITLYNITIP